ncbi:MAG: hypothetical protein Q9188_000361 [Gyalolechia gomerana]
MPLTEAQVNALAITERVVSVFSIIGIFFILFTFYFLKSFHKPINRLIFFASFGNLGMNIACLIAEDGISSEPNSGLCTFQAFLIQMFLGVDAFWACCMAWNVYLAFFHKYTARQLRHLDKWYLLGCYGASFVPALTLAFIDTTRRGRIYGPAILWCWITIEWDFLRIALLYGIVWLAIIFAFAIYIKAGRVIYKRRDTLRGFLNPLNEHPFNTGTVTTSIDITVHHVTSPSEDSAASANNNIRVFDKDFDPASNADAELDEFHPYIVNIEAPERRPSGVRKVTREVARKETTNPGAWLYARVAFLFFLSMLIIWVRLPLSLSTMLFASHNLSPSNTLTKTPINPWRKQIPSSANRVYALAHPTRINFPLNFVSALVLPAQGFLNVIVYIITSQTAMRQILSSVRGNAKMPWRDDLFAWRHKITRNGGRDARSKGNNPRDREIQLELADLEKRIGGKGAGKKVWEKRSLGGYSERGSEVNVPIMAHTRAG